MKINERHYVEEVLKRDSQRNPGEMGVKMQLKLTVLDKPNKKYAREIKAKDYPDVISAST